MIAETYSTPGGAGEVGLSDIRKKQEADSERCVDHIVSHYLTFPELTEFSGVIWVSGSNGY